MLNLYCKLKALRATRDRGVTTVEYALIVMVIVAVVVGAVWGLLTVVGDRFNDGCNNLGGSC